MAGWSGMSLLRYVDGVEEGMAESMPDCKWRMKLMNRVSWDASRERKRIRAGKFQTQVNCCEENRRRKRRNRVGEGRREKQTRCLFSAATETRSTASFRLRPTTPWVRRELASTICLCFQGCKVGKGWHRQQEEHQ